MRLLATVVLAGVLLFLLGPLVLVVIVSFSANPLISLPLRGPTLDWYRRLAADPEFWSALRNSLVIAATTASLATITGTAAALGLARAAAGQRTAMLVATALPVMLPPLVLAVALVVFFARVLALPLSPATTIAAHLVITQPFVLLVVLARLASFDHACVDAARDLGASPWTAFRRVTLPNIRAALIGAWLIAAAVSLDDFILTVFTIGRGNTLATFVWGRMKTTLDPSINAIATILLVLTVGATLIALRLTRWRGGGGG
jgi:spermidine/putrescine transport system permease protein